MMRNALLWASTNPFLAERLPQYGFVKRATERFMPGEGLNDALGEASKLEVTGANTTVTLLGETLASVEARSSRRSSARRSPSSRPNSA